METIVNKYKTLYVAQYDSNMWPIEFIVDGGYECHLESDSVCILSYSEVDVFHFLSNIGIYYITGLVENVGNVIFEYIS